MILYTLYIVLSSFLWGTTLPSPMSIFGAKIYLLDIVFLLIIYYGWKKRRSEKLIRATTEYAVGTELAVFLSYTVLLFFYSLSIGCSFTNAIRFCINIFHYSIYFVIPYIVTNRKRLSLLFRIVSVFLLIAYIVTLSQNLIGWQPSSAVEAASMSVVEKVGMFYRTWNPVQQCLVAATCFSLTWIIFTKASMNSVLIFLGLLIFVFFSFTRNVYIGLIAALVLLLLQKVHFQGNKKILDVLKAVVIIAVILAIVLPMFPFVIERFQAGLIEISEEGGTYGHRLNMLLVAQALMNNPWIGVGFESIDIQMDYGSVNSILLASVNSGADSHLIMLYYRFGIIGIILFGYLSIAFIMKTFRRIKTMGVNRDSVFLIGAVTYTIMIWIQATVSSSLLSEPSIGINLTAWAVADCIWRFHNEESLESA